MIQLYNKNKTEVLWSWKFVESVTGVIFFFFFFF